ncbi:MULTISPECIES: hypothetical protein [unclassified Rhizobium]|uniref:hypothetical protein n=1 Tax=unclassified Rhizobium TaxID=2613769 RepID=UPI000DE13413|nr:MULTISPECIES: hypothetical protein [unclassified Rhizobium]MBB3290061.1 hypothetical protein [Rhizobium sp. BK252]MBB3404843.1 hypothetical protein [Rhizobium sp. BK289]MBB3417279.1 hypothetical protein [Rhizobium sp. BK284]MBB3485419.1 hypothetical protein [Rhizobium sp. BK347]MDK4722560.1 hypothetical protein [Rhizobium sp. CNPSo 3968]
MRGVLVLYLALVAALPAAVMATVLPVNTYRAQGIDALDCDGPIGVLIFALPALLVYGAGAILLYRKRKRRFHLAASLCCLLIFCAAGWSAAAALRESYGPASAEACA